MVTWQLKQLLPVMNVIDTLDQVYLHKEKNDKNLAVKAVTGSYEGY